MSCRGTHTPTEVKKIVSFGLAYYLQENRQAMEDDTVFILPELWFLEESTNVIQIAQEPQQGDPEVQEKVNGTLNS